MRGQVYSYNRIKKIYGSRNLKRAFCINIILALSVVCASQSFETLFHDCEIFTKRRPDCVPHEREQESTMEEDWEMLNDEQGMWDLVEPDKPVLPLSLWETVDFELKLSKTIDIGMKAMIKFIQRCQHRTQSTICK